MIKSIQRFLFIVFLLFLSVNSYAESETTRVLLGLTIDKSGNIVASNPQIEYILPNIEKTDPRKLLDTVKYLPPLAINYEDRITGKNVQGHLCDVSIQDMFRLAFIKYAQKNERVEDYTLLVATRVFSDSRPLISVWWFTCIKTKDLDIENLK